MICGRDSPPGTCGAAPQGEVPSPLSRPTSSGSRPSDAVGRSSPVAGLDFTSNDYLGFANSLELRRAMEVALSPWSAHSGAGG